MILLSNQKINPSADELIAKTATLQNWGPGQLPFHDCIGWPPVQAHPFPPVNICRQKKSHCHCNGISVSSQRLVGLCLLGD